MSEIPVGPAVQLVAVLATHALVGYALGRVAVDRPRAGAVGGVAADVDLVVPAAWGWPLAHRGITHTAVAALVAVVLAYVVSRRRDVAVAVGLGYASQLLIDVATPEGVVLWYPVSTRVVTLPGDAHGPAATVVLWLVCLALLGVERVRRARSA